MNEWDLLTQLLGGQTSLPKSRYIFRENPFAQSPMDGLGLNLPLDIGSLQTSQPLLEISGLQFNQPAVFDPSEAIRRIDQTNANLQAAISASSQPAAEPNKWEKFKNFMGQYGPLIFAGLGALTGDVMYGSAAQNWLNAKEMERQRKLQEQQIAEEQRRWQLAQDLANEERLYRRYRDQVSDNRAAEDLAWKRDWMANERDYNRWRDVVQDERYADETEYRRSRDKIQDKRYEDSVRREEAKFQWQKETDARDFAEGKRRFDITASMKAESGSGGSRNSVQEIKQRQQQTYNDIGSLTPYYRRKKDFLADLERHKTTLVNRMGLDYYNKLYNWALNSEESQYGSQWLPAEKRKVKSGPLTFYLNNM